MLDGSARMLRTERGGPQRCPVMVARYVRSGARRWGMSAAATRTVIVKYSTSHSKAAYPRHERAEWNILVFCNSCGFVLSNIPEIDLTNLEYLQLFKQMSPFYSITASMYSTTAT